MPDDKESQGAPEPDTESSERPEDEAPTEEHEATASETQASDVATVEVLAGEIEELRAKAAERDTFLDKLQRTTADFINYQKRVQRERERWTEMAIQSLLLRLLAVLDDVGRALATARQARDIEALISGLELIQAKLLKAIRDDGVTPFEAMGKPFDPAFHEAVAHQESPSVPDQSVIEVLRAGYMIGDRVLRPAQVVVARGSKQPEEA